MACRLVYDADTIDVVHRQMQAWVLPQLHALQQVHWPALYTWFAAEWLHTTRNMGKKQEEPQLTKQRLLKQPHMSVMCMLS